MSRLGIVAALRSEVALLTHLPVPLREPVTPAPHVLLMRCGMGADNAQAAAQQLLQQGATALLSWGTAVALAPSLHPGTLVLPETLLNAEQHRYSVDTAWRERVLGRLPASVEPDRGPMVESRGIIETPADKRVLHAQTACSAADMESLAIARVAERADVPFLALRVIVDSAVMRLPTSLLRALDGNGEVALGRLLRAIGPRPQDWPALWHLARGFSAASRTLRQIARQVGPDFVFDAAGR
jgi:adenosylhomocysteine nucleosidase